MDEIAFRKYLKGFGKKEHVIDGLVRQVAEFAAFLESERRKTLPSADNQDLQAYASRFKPAERKTRVRGLIFYFRFTGKPELSALAHALREEQTAKTRRVFLLKDFRGISNVIVDKLAALGIRNVEQMLAAGLTPEARRLLAGTAGVPPEVIIELVKLSDLARLGAVKQVRARLYYEAGIDTPEKIAVWEPEALRLMLIAFIDRTGFEGIPPLPKEVQNLVVAARNLPKLVQY
jgi:hypothetical protein